jgi:peroxiredoxin
LGSNPQVATLLSFELNLRACKVLRQSRSRFRAGMSILAETAGVVTLYPESEVLAMTALQVTKDIESLNKYEARKLLVLLSTECGQTQAGRIAAGQLRIEAMLNKPVELSVTAVDGREVSIASLRGKVVLIAFVAAGHTSAMLDVDSLYEKYAEQGLAVIGVGIDTDRDRFKALIEQLDMAWPVYCDGKGWDSPVVSRFGVDSAPMTLLIDRVGRLRGITPVAAPEMRIRRLLEEPAPAPTTAPATRAAQ